VLDDDALISSGKVPYATQTSVKDTGRIKGAGGLRTSKGQPSTSHTSQGIGGKYHQSYQNTPTSRSSANRVSSFPATHNHYSPNSGFEML
jgi:hypothetical protein